MARTSAWRSVAAAVLAAAMFACKEEVTAPGRCPELCPADSLLVQDTVIAGIVVSDTSIRGFTDIAHGPILLLSTLDSLEAYAVLKFQALPQRWFVGTDSIRIGTIDSVTIQLQLAARDSTVDNTRLLLYRLPALVDTSGAFDSVVSFFRNGAPFDSVLIADSLRTTVLTQRLSTALLTPLAADSFVQSLGVAVRADRRTIAILSSVDLSGVPPRLKFYVHGAAPRDTFRTTFDLLPLYDSYVQSPAPSTPPPGRIVIGNAPAARSYLRFNLPSYFVDSVTVVRATLRLTPLRPTTGFPGETFTIEAQPILRYFAGKSLILGDTSLTGRGPVAVGQDTTVRVDVGRIVRFWRGISPDSLPRAVVLHTGSEAFTFGQLDAGGSGAGAKAPTIQITYLRPFRFGVP